MTKKSKSQVIGLDVLRFTAAMWVVLFHLAYWAHAAPFLSHALVRGYGDYPALTPVTQLGWLGVPMFFVISGFVIAFSAKSADPFSFFASRVVRLFPGMLICATLILSLALWKHLRAPNEAVLSYLRSILFLPFGPYIDDSCWTLSIEITFYAIIWAMLVTSNFAKIRIIALLIGLASTTFWLLQSTTNVVERVVQHLPMRVLDLLLLTYGIYFAIGVIIWLMNAEHSRRDWVWLAIFTIAACRQIDNQNSGNILITGNYTNTIMPIAAFVVFLLAFWASVKWNEKLHEITPVKLVSFCRQIGLMTYPLYLIHQLSGAYALGVFVRWTNLRYVSLFAVIAGCVVLAWLVASKLEPPLQRKTKLFLYWARENTVRLRRDPSKVL